MQTLNRTDTPATASVPAEELLNVEAVPAVFREGSRARTTLQLTAALSLVGLLAVGSWFWFQPQNSGLRAETGSALTDIGGKIDNLLKGLFGGGSGGETSPPEGNAFKRPGGCLYN